MQTGDAIGGAYNADEAFRAFARTLKIAASVDAVGGALSALGRRFRMSQLAITDVAKVSSAPVSSVLYSARSLPDLRDFFRGRPLATHPVFRRSWADDAPPSLSEIKHELVLSEAELWDMMPPWAHGHEALSVNVKPRSGAHLNFAYAGIGADVSGGARSLLTVASHMAGERFDQLDRGEDVSVRLTPREQAVLRMLSEGKPDEAIGRELGISARTARFHVANVKAKLGAGTRMQAVLKFLRDA